jgi:DMSO/TMAO reductase YedYZ molybdopterin-dependent catalytic subunit
MWVERAMTTTGRFAVMSRIRIVAPLCFALILALLGPAARAQPAPAAGVDSSDVLEVTGKVVQPRSFSHADLAGLPALTLPVTYGSGQGIESATFSGPTLLEVIQAAGGPTLDPNRKNDRLRLYVVATGSDGYQAVIAWGEIDPDFGGQPILVAYAENGQDLPAEQGMARLVVPGDKRGGRHVNHLIRLDVQTAS